MTQFVNLHGSGAFAQEPYPMSWHLLRLPMLRGLGAARWPHGHFVEGASHVKPSEFHIRTD